MRRSRSIVVSASASVLEGREFPAGSYQDLVNWYRSLLPGARCAEELQGSNPEHTNKPSEMKPEIAQTQSWRCKTIAVTKRQQQNPHIKQANEPRKSFEAHLLQSIQVNVLAH